MKLGLMQRISPRVDGKYQAFPYSYWRNEMYMAEEFGFDAIELVFDDYDNHPLRSDRGANNILNTISSTKLEISSVCADYFMKHPIHIEDNVERKQNILMLNMLIEKCAWLNIKHIILPCVDESSIKTEEESGVLQFELYNLLPSLEMYQVCLNIESDFSPEKLFEFVNDFDSSNILINYDMGNSASLGYDPIKEIEAYKNKLGTVHIKDRELGGKFVKLGTGEVDFKTVFTKLEDINYQGTLTLQAFREEDYAEDLDTFREQFQFVQKLIKKETKNGT